MLDIPTPSFVRNMKVSHMVWLIAIMGILLAAMFAQTKLRDEARLGDEMRSISSLVELSVKMSDYVHEQQKERGATAIFLSSQGTQYREELQAQRILTDQRFNAVKTQATRLLQSSMNTDLKRDLAALLEKAEQRAETRSRVDSLSIERGAALGFYTGLNHDVIHFIGGTSRGVTNASIANNLMNYSAFLMGKDSAGIERALGASGFAVGSFSPALKQNLSRHITTQNAMIGQFSAFADTELNTALQTVLESDVSQQVESLRVVALTGTPDEIAPISASQWFDLSTSRINGLKQLEDQVADSLLAQAGSGLAQANQSFWSNAVLLTLTVLFGAIFSTYLVLVVSRAFRDVLNPLQQLADGNLDVALPKRTDNEFGEIVSALEIFKNNETQRRDDDRNREKVLDTLASGLHALSDGNFVDKIDDKFPDSYERLRKDFNSSKSSVSGAMVRVVHAVQDIRHGVAKVRQDAGDLSHRTEGQAATLEQTAAALEQMTASVKSTSESVLHTNQFVSTVADGVRNSRDVAQKTVATMNDIESSSSQISQIVTVIEDIAFQTNLLALNAGVEAARAGEAGRGFGVVASEVRALAGRSAEAAKQITKLIEANEMRVGEGVNLIQNVSDALEDIVKKTEDVAKHVSDISIAANEQSTGLAEINAAVSQLDHVTQQNASMVEQTTSFSIGLSNDAEELMRLISRFQIGDVTRGIESPVAGLSADKASEAA